MNCSIIVVINYMDGTKEEISDSSIKFATLRANLLLSSNKVSSVELKKVIA